MTTVNVKSRAALGTPFCPHSYIQSSNSKIQADLITLFKKWEKPKSIREDTVKPHGDPQRKCLPILEGTGYQSKIIFNCRRNQTDRTNATEYSELGRTMLQ